MSNIKKLFKFLFPIVLRALLLTVEKELQKNLAKTPAPMYPFGGPVRRPYSEKKRIPGIDKVVCSDARVAQEILDHLRILARRNEYVTVSDLNDLVICTSTFSDAQWGWTESDLEEVMVKEKEIKFSPSEWYIPLPNPRPIYRRG